MQVLAQSLPGAKYHSSHSAVINENPRLRPGNPLGLRVKAALSAAHNLLLRLASAGGLNASVMGSGPKSHAVYRETASIVQKSRRPVRAARMGDKMEILFESNYLGSRVRLYDTWLEHEAFGERRVVPLNRILEIYPLNPLVAGVHIEGGPFNGTVGVWGAQKQALVDAVRDAISRVGDEAVLRVVCVGGYGSVLEQGEEYFAAFGADGLTVSHPWATESLSLRYRDIEGFDIGGPGVMESNAGLIGGGFGLAGAVTGMVVAGLVNEVTRTRSVETGIWWKAGGSEVFLFTDSSGPESLRVELSAQMSKMRLSNGTIPRPVDSDAQPQDVVTQLKDLAEMHAQGVLSDAEFLAAKQRILT